MLVEQTKSEDLLVLFACHPSTSNVDKIIKSLKHMFKIKRENDNTDRFNFIAFQENGPVFFEDFLFDYSYIIDTLKDLKGSLVPSNLSGGIMVAITFIIDVFKIVGDKVFRLLIVSDKSARKLANIEVLENLISNIIDFPFYMDIVRYATDDPREDFREIKFVKKFNGNVLFAENIKKLNSVLENVAEKKELPKSVFDGKNFHIPKENYPFFENLAQDLWMVEGDTSGENKCQICRMSDNDLVKCPKCESISHPDCLAKWAEMSNIGIPNVFRCMNCFNLLKLPADFVQDVQSGRYKRQAQFQSTNQNDYLLQKESSATPQLQQGSDPLGGMSWDDEDAYSDDEYQFKDDSELEIQFCDDCGTLNLPEALNCSKCGKKL